MKLHRNSIISILRRLTKGNSSTQLADPLATLSGGGRAVVRVLRSVIWRYKLLLLDEPLANVDAANRELLFENLREHTPNNATVLLISHDDHDHETFRKHFDNAVYQELLLEHGQLSALGER